MPQAPEDFLLIPLYEFSISSCYHKFSKMLGIKKPAQAAGSSAPAIIIGIFVSFGGILFGYVLLLRD